MAIEHAHAGTPDCICYAMGDPWWEDEEVMRQLDLREAREWVRRNR